MRWALVPLTLLVGCSDRVASPQRGDLVISEVVTSNADDEHGDWVELENRTDRKLDLAGLWISDTENKPMKHQLARGAPIILEPNAMLLLSAEGKTDQGPLHLPFKLSKKGETILISTQNGSRIDAVAVPRMRTGQSYARIAGRLEVCNTPTPQAANVCTVGKQSAED